MERRAAIAPEALARQVVADCEDGSARLARVVHGEDLARGAGGVERTIVATLVAAGEPLGRTAVRDKMHARNERLGEAITRLVA